MRLRKYKQPAPFRGEVIDTRPEIRRLIFLGLTTDGAHHKQWYLEQIAMKMQFMNMPDHEPGIAP